MNYFSLLNEGRFRLVLAILLWVGFISAGYSWYNNARVDDYAFAAGPVGSESFELAAAIAEVYNKQSTDSKILVLETSGSDANAKLLRDGQVEFATLQADTQLAANVQVIASLYADAYQLIVRGDSDIHRVGDLAGHRIAIAPTGSGQYDSFWFLADHYGLDRNELIALPMAEAAGNFAMIQQQVDAVFRVSAPGNQSISELVENHDMRFVPIYQAKALSLQRPTLMPGVVPLGSYRGEPPLPAQDEATAVLERMLASRATVPEPVVQGLTQLLFERRAELVARNRLAGFIGPVATSGKISAPVHAGAERYYNREKPGFIESNTRLVASLLYVLAILCSAALALRSTLLKRHRKRLVDYNRQLMELAQSANETSDSSALNSIKQQLVRMLGQVVQDLEDNRVNQDEFDHFSFLWGAVDTSVRDKLGLAPMSTTATGGQHVEHA